MKIPQAPLNSSNENLHKTLTDVVNFISAFNQNGLAFKGFSQDEINSMTEPTQAGKIVFNETTGKPNRSEIDPTTKTITWKEF